MTLIKNRIVQQWQFNYNLLKDIVDWIVWLYICVPTGLFSYYLYRETIVQKQFGLLEWVPVELFLFALFLLLQIGIIRSFLEPADQLFLIQQRKLMQNLLFGGLLYSLSLQVLLNGAVLGLLSFVMIHLYGRTGLEIIFVFTLSIASFLCKQLIVRTGWHEWLQSLMQFLLPFLTTTFFLVVPVAIGIMISSSFMILLLVIYIHRYVLRLCSFDRLLRLDRARYYFLVGTIFTLSEELRSMKVPKETGNKPRFFTQRIIQDEVVEMMVKTLIRNSKYKWAYVRLIGTTLLLYFVLPFWAQIILVIATYFMLIGYTDSVLGEIRNHPIRIIFQFSDDRWNAAHLTMKNKLVRFVMGFVLMYFIGIIIFFN